MSYDRDHYSRSSNRDRDSGRDSGRDTSNRDRDSGRDSYRDRDRNRRDSGDRHDRGHEDQVLDCKIYVGDLPRNCTERDIEDHFGSCGRLKNVWVARNPSGFAFVEFEDPRDAEDAVRRLDGISMKGSRIRVEQSTGKVRSKPWMKRGPPRSRKPFHPDDKCFECHGRGHYAYDCPNAGRRRHSRSRSRSSSRDRSRRSRRHSRSRSKSRSRSRSYSRSRSKSRSRSHHSRRSRSGSRKSNHSHHSHHSNTEKNGNKSGDD